MSPSVPLGDKGFTQKEIALISKCIRHEHPTEEEMHAFFDPDMMQQRISEWFEKYRSGEIRPPETSAKSERHPFFQMVSQVPAGLKHEFSQPFESD